jgi:imidazole glycerol-phosphate synthase subunit HisF
MRARLIPVLLMDRRHRLVKTVGFGARTYIGDPFNVVRLFNEKEVDELCVLDIDATRDGRGPDFDFLAELASECFMPLSYGGGISTLAQAERLNRAGIEKLVIGANSSDANLVQALCRDFGTQAVVACVDVRGAGAAARCFVANASRPTQLAPVDLCRRLADAGVGEILLQSVDRDGARTGYDLDLIRSVAGSLPIPVVALGGAGEMRHLAQALAAGASAAASGSAFTFIGRLRAVLISYPTHAEMDRVLGSGI